MQPQHKHTSSSHRTVKTAQGHRSRVDALYFESYGYSGIHQEMLEDKVTADGLMVLGLHAGHTYP